MPNHFQTSFYVRFKNQGDHDTTLMYFLQKRLYKWFRQKEKRLADTIGAPQDNRIDRQFFQNFSRKVIHTFFKTKSLCRTVAYVEPTENGKLQTSAWAMRYIHGDSQLTYSRKWHIDVGIREISNTVCMVNVLLKYEADKYCLLKVEGDHQPVPTIPNFVRQLVVSNTCDVALDEQFVLTCQNAPLYTNAPQTADNVFCWIQDYRRKYVIIVFNGNSCKDQALELQKNLVGKALVVVLGDGHDMGAYLSSLPTDLYVPYNGMRVFYPMDDYTNMGAVNRKVRASEIEANMEEITRNMLASFELHNSLAIRSIEDVYSLIATSQFKHKLNLIKQEKEAVENSHPLDQSEEIARLEEELSQRTEENEYILAQCVELEGKATTYRKRIDCKDGKILELETKLRRASTLGLELARATYPKRLIDVVDYVEQLLSDRIVILEKAKKSAAEYSDFSHPDIAWNMLSDIGIKIYDLKYREGNFSEEAVRSLSRFAFSMSESSTSQGDAALMKEREIEYQGKTFVIKPHLKYGSTPPKCLRVHFAFDEQENKIVIGYIGPHLTTAGTKRRGY